MYLTPVTPVQISGKGSIIEKTSFYEGGEIEKSTFDLAIIGVRESRGAADNEGCEKAPDIFRNFFYKLVYDDPQTSILDMGDIKPGESLKDTLVALEQVVEECLKLNILKKLRDKQNLLKALENLMRLRLKKQNLFPQLNLRLQLNLKSLPLM